MENMEKRVVDYLRVSITDRCNLRCRYCMPDKGISLVPHSETLRYEELLRVVACAARAGIQKIKVTGGEPLVRRGVLGFLEKLRGIKGIRQVTMTTNGILLPQFLPQLAQIGVEAVNVSLDTLNPETFRAITRRDGLADVLRGIDAALTLGLRIKINAVPIAGLNEDELPALAELAKDKPLDVRFIELMPIGCGAAFTPVKTDEVRHRLEQAFGPLMPWEGRRGNGPARYVSVEGFAGKIGFISPLSHSFCRTCNRLRLTATGLLKPCLASGNAVPLWPLLRTGAGDAQLTALLEKTITQKPLAQDFAQMNASCPEQKKMAQIGG
ncbi:GTP 3',8-cyclase MoaA [Ethanoligenens harbinense]|uniref:GTP 3',8-cyclase n=1 Tax=Ethanoligenens harbinense (strain DSM 18485 / JCM 12961 / CGMCC 1.5033 / YUAN-3) TaxID=663278 RepID=E6U3C7_ETHHY|nr:GTP 3',8-cyclase MoaA [Ethanoligenens harbinense]ADU26419.1 molybdenum cofactor biosynthesis protein A [Ethanoligenens harbinense YUAN-3]AVQ95541.1 GTP 3',8-cyclase MoaA [Ethanoligenens harbinense YUAN-3]AYF38205.1 GTP 3',8-cyclase MoaA [Ethanoligenens harbinense]AYF40950.1 GTP 3',8-cyclase MoaA [Ethanoligenens harbinense]QCN91783.1 GTP 3',8-cyclase MoaA [Ethanoligenens harbinense]